MTTKKKQEIIIPPHLQDQWDQLMKDEDYYSKKVEESVERLRKLLAKRDAKN